MTSPAARTLHSLAALALAILCPEAVEATNFSWTSTGGEFDTAANWTQSGVPVDLDGVPDSNDVVTFDRGNVPQYLVVFGTLLIPNTDIHPIVDKLVIGNNPLSFVGLYGSTLTVDSANITETARGVVIGSGAGDVAALTSTLATFDTQYATLGSAAGSSGTLTLASASAGAFSVSGTGATYDLIVGLNGTGTINVSNGRDVTVSDDTVLGQNATGVGNVSLSGAGSTWTNTGDFNVGLSGIGTLNVSGGGQISDATGYLASTNGLTSTATISGAGSSWTNSIALIVANHGMATLEVNSGAQVTSSTSGYVGYFADAIGSATVTGANSTWTNSLSTIVGSSGNGSLTVSSGGLVSDTFGVVGSAVGSVSTSMITGTNSRWTNSSDLFVGDGGNGTLDILAGGEVTNVNGYIGDDAGSIGEATVDGSDSHWTNTGDLHVGNAGSGTLSIAAGARVNSTNTYVGQQAGSTGILTVGGMGSRLSNTGDLYVGNAGSGTLNITAGGQVYDEYGSVGAISGSSGAVTVDGVGSFWDNLVFSVGGGADSTLDISNRGDVRATGGVGSIGGPAGTTTAVTVDGAGSGLSVSSEFDAILQVGYGGVATLEITNGAGVVVNSTAFNYVLYTARLGIGSDAGSIVTVDGPGSTLSVQQIATAQIVVGGTIDFGAKHGTLNVANEGYVTTLGQLQVTSLGTLNISGGGRVTDSNGVVVGQVTVDGVGSTWTNNASLSVAGSVTVSNGGTILADSITVGVSGEVGGNGTVDGQVVNNGRVGGDLLVIGDVENNGLVSPGMSPGTLHFDGNFTQTPAGELLIELASALSYDQLFVTGVATLGGTLTVNLIDGFTPSIGQTLTILTADDVDGTFTTEMLPSVPNLAFDVIYNAQSVVVTVFSALPGDYNGDGTVDAADYTVWRDNVGGSTLPNEGASFGTVDDLDYDFWMLHFGETAGSDSAGASVSRTAVPEPAAITLMALGCVLVRRRPVA